VSALVALAVLVVVTVLGAVLAVRAVRSGSDDRETAARLRRIVSGARPASEPFAGLTAADVRIGGRCLHAVVADTLTEREEGLRGRSDLGGYDVMLFVFATPSTAAFTMSTVPVALDIGFYGADGRPVSRRHMVPCAKVESACPVYAADGPFSYAVESLGGQLPQGSLAACPG
jgi:uncharacterized membrane protein (UPF0127 family)